MKKKDKELHQSIDAILWYDWDPIGIKGNENLWDEYLGYTSHLFHLKKEGADVRKIADHLYRVITIDMGMYGFKANMEHCKMVAQKIIDL